MSEQFTNRRGHSLVIDDEEVLMVEPVIDPVLPVTTKKPLHRARQPGGLVKWLVLIVGSVLLLVIATFEIVRFSYVTSVEAARRQVDELVNSDVAAAATQSPLASGTISNLQARFKDISMSLCPGGLLDNYATLYPRAKQALDGCTDYRSRVESLVKELGGMADATQYLERLKPILAPLAEPLQDRFAVLSSQQESWRLAMTDLKDITPVAEFQSAHYVLVERVSVVVETWTGLVAASNARNSASYRELRDQLPGMYAAVRVSADELEKVLSAVQTRLTNAYEALK